MYHEETFHPDMDSDLMPQTQTANIETTLDVEIWSVKKNGSGLKLKLKCHRGLFNL